MIGFICIMHSCKNCSRKDFTTINNFIKSLYKFCKRDFILYLFDNASDKIYNVPKYNNIKYIYIEDQTLRGLAGPYNDGIRMAIKDKCDLIILINDDLELNATINNFIDTIRKHNLKSIGLYGPLTNGVIKRSPQLANKKGNGLREITNNHSFNLNGFLMAFTPQFYHKFKLPNGDFCDMKKKWSGGEEILHNRVRNNGGRIFIIKSCWIYHRRYSDWNKIEKWSKPDLPQDINKIKWDIVNKYGAELTIGYYYYSFNPIEYVGEEQVRKSFDSVKKYGKNVIIGDYGSTDGIKELTEEYGFTFLNVDKTPNIFFHESKIANKIIKEAPQNFLCYLNFWITYPENLQDYLINWLKTHHGQKQYLKATGYAMKPNGKTYKTNPKKASHSVTTLLYRPFLYEARGYDERTSYTAGTRNYAVGLMQRIFKLKPDHGFIDFVHIPHTNRHWDKVKKEERKIGHAACSEIIWKLHNNFNNGRKQVQNSYW